MKALGPHAVLEAIGQGIDGDSWWPVDRAYHEAHGTDPMEEIVLGAVLVQNTAWVQVERALDTLREANACDIKSVAEQSLDQLTQMVRSAGFQQRKPGTLQALARAMLDDGGIRLLRESVKDDPDPARVMLLEVHGVGPETADSILLYALDAPVFVVDAYTRRLMGRLGIVLDGPVRDPFKAPYKAIADWWRAELPRTAGAYRQAHAAIVHHAQTLCRKQPDCPRCPLQGVCRFAKSQAA